MGNRDLELNDALRGDDALRKAVEKPDLSEIRYLLGQRNVNPNIKLEGRTLLAWACSQEPQKEYAEVVSLLLKYKAEPNPPESNELTPLISAIEAKNFRAAQALLKAKADPNAVYKGETALMKAAEWGNVKLGKLLIKAGADPTMRRDSDNRYPYQIAYRHRHTRFKKMLPKVHSQRWFIRRIGALYEGPEPRGDCFAVAHVGLQAALARDISSFNERFSKIGEIPTAKIRPELEKAKAHFAEIQKETRAQVKKEMLAKIHITSYKVFKIFNEEIEDITSAELTSKEIEELNKLKKQFNEKFAAELEINKNNSLTKIEKILLDFEILGGEIKLYQESATFSFLPDAGHTILQAQQTMKMVQPVALDKKGGIAHIDNFSSMYQDFEGDDSEIVKHFSTLKAILDKSKLQDPVSMLLCNNNHAITVVYDPQAKQWTLIDANQYPIAQNIRDEASLAKEICEAFSTDNRIAGFSTNIYATGVDAKEAMRCIDEWKNTETFQKIHTPTPERIALKASNGCRWRDVAEYGGNSAVMAQVYVPKKSFLKRRWGAILFGACMGIMGVTGIAVASVFTFGIAPLVAAAIIGGAGAVGALTGVGIGKILDLKSSKKADAIAYVKKLEDATDHSRKEIRDKPVEIEMQAIPQPKIATEETPIMLKSTTQMLNEKLATNFIPLPANTRSDKAWAERLIANDPSYREKITSLGAADLLKNEKPYTYILRDSSEPGILTISYKEPDGKISNLRCDKFQYGSCKTVQEVLDVANKDEKIALFHVTALPKEVPKIESPLVELTFKEKMENNPAFMGQMNRDAAERKLGGRAEGSFVIRNASVPGAYAVSVKIGGNAKPLHILCTEKEYGKCDSVKDIYEQYYKKYCRNDPTWPQKLVEESNINKVSPAA